MSASYSCFFHPQAGRNYKSLEEKCPSCDRLFGWPLFSPPESIAGRPVVECKSRGFYGATYVVKDGGLQQPRIMKLVPTLAYETFKKDWAREVQAHNDLVNHHHTHFARVFDAGTADVTFADGTIIPCHWATMDHVAGETLDKYTKAKELNISAVAQIALDLLEILRVLHAKQMVHNDLHAGNIIVTELAEGDRRAGAIHEGIRAVAIDFGSLTDIAIDGRPTDSQRVGEILQDFTRALLQGDPNKIDSRAYRLASELTRLREIFQPGIGAVRVPNYEELKEQIRIAARFASGLEWTTSGTLSVAAEGYNAQTLKPAAIAKLLVDDQKWTDEIASGGAQIVLGMRGCGKTMLLRSLDFHARAALSTAEGASDAVTRVAKDGFIGVYVSAVRLLDARTSPQIDFRPLLFAAYAREAARVLMHMEFLHCKTDPQAARWLSDVVQTYLAGVELPVAPTSISLDQALQRILFTVASGEAKHPLKTSASTAFMDLARAITLISSDWNTPRVLFLLDDVSTRYLDDKLIRNVLSEVLFQNDSCAFKVTTETQTLVSILRSPGGIEALREDRDYRLFNLGERVTQRLKDEGWGFIDNLLHRRLSATERHTALKALRPAQILGSRKLEDIAAAIAESDASAAERQSVYSGIEALAAMCVGDIGDTITLFDRMIERANGDAVSAKEQTAAYKQLCGQRLWELASKDVALKDQALGFAEAAHELLRSSFRKRNGGRVRLRQYTKVYVRDLNDEAFEKIRRLIDAGVFAIEGGIPRTKTKDADPITHFVLAFRKVLGVNSWIGLSDRDRFELSGESTLEWLQRPEHSKAVLIRNQDTKHDFEAAVGQGKRSLKKRGKTQLKGEHEPLQPSMFVPAEQVSAHQLPPASFPRLRVEILQSLPNHFELLLTGFGFEERARISAERIASATRADSIHAVRYADGLGNPEISVVFEPWRAAITEISPKDHINIRDGEGDILIDVTGMNTALIWSSVRKALRSRREVWLAYTRAERYWPSEAEINRVLGEGPDEVPADSRQLSTLRGLVSGEKGDYRVIPLLGVRDDIMRPLCLVAVSSPKMQRLEHLLESRAFDRLEIIAAKGSNPRARLSRLAGNAAAVGIASGPLHPAAPTDLSVNVTLLQHLYQSLFVDGGMDVALGLTGSKVQSIAMAALSAAVKVAEAWYIQPAAYDTKQFTRGAAATIYFKIALEEM